MRIYLCSRFGRADELEGYAKRLEAVGHHITSRWHRSADHRIADDRPEHNARLAEEDLMDLMEADAIVAFTEAGDGTGRRRGGRHVEFGVALAMYMLNPTFRPLLGLVGPRENVFHWLPYVGQFDTFEAISHWLQTQHSALSTQHSSD